MFRKNVWKNNLGQSTLEMAILLPFVLFIFFAIINIGLYIHAQLQIAYAAHQGARIGALTNENSKIQGAINESLQTLPGQAERVSVQISPPNESSRERGDELRVTITYSYPMPVHFKMPFGITNDFFDRDSISLISTALSRIEYED